MTEERDRGPDPDVPGDGPDPNVPDNGPDPDAPDQGSESADADSKGSAPDDADLDDGRPLTAPDGTDHGKTPFHFVRALLLTMPLAILVGSVVAPPDAVAQLVLIAGTLVGGLPITYRLVAHRRFGPKELGAFFGIVLVVTLVGLWALQAVGSGPVPDILLRFGIVFVSLLVADLLVFRYLDFDGG